MAGPWEKYAKKKSGPWEKYATTESRQSQPELEVVATTDDGGAVYRGPDGNLSFTSPGFSTNDPARIEQIMQGATPRDIAQQGFDQEVINQAPFASRAVKAVEGTPFVGSYLDEAAGAMFGDKARQGVRAVSGAMERQNPGESAALQLGGAVAGAVPMAMAAAPAALANAGKTLGAKALQTGFAGGVLGAVEGAVYGSGKEGDRVAGAQEGAAFGLGAGTVFGVAAPYVSKAVSSTLRWLRGSSVGTIAKELSLSPGAARVVKSALDAGDLDEAAKALERAGPGAMLADAGQPAAQLLDAAAATGGAAGRIAREGVDTRVSRVSKELTDTLDNTFGKPSDLKDMSKAVRDETEGVRNSVYDAAYAKPIDYSGDRGRALQKLLRRVPKSAVDEANQALIGGGFDESPQIIAKIADDGRVTYERLPDVRQIDYITRSLKDIADRFDGMGKMRGQTTLGATYSNLYRNIRKILQKEVPEFKTAVDTASDAISRVKAGEIGYDLLRAKTKRGDVRRALAGASDAEKKAAKEGIRTYIDDTLSNVSRTVMDSDTEAREAIKLLKDMSSRANKQKIEMVIGKRAAHKLFDELDTATVAFELRAALAQNSKTAIRQSIQRGASEQAQPAMLELLASGEPVQASKRFVQIFTGSTPEAQALREAGIYEEIAKALTQTKGWRAKKALELVEGAMRGEKVSEAQASVIGNVVAGSTYLTGNREASRVLSTQ